MDRAGHLLVEEDVAEVAVDALVAAEAELAEAARARVRLEGRLQALRARVRPRLDHDAALQYERTPPTPRPRGSSKRTTPSTESSTGEK